MGNQGSSSVDSSVMMTKLVALKKEYDALANQTSGRELLNLLDKLRCIINDEENDELTYAFVSVDVGVSTILMDLITRNNFEGEIVAKALLSFRVASIGGTDVKLLLASRSFGLVPLLMQVIDRNAVGNEACVEALKILESCCQASREDP